MALNVHWKAACFGSACRVIDIYAYRFIIPIKYLYYLHIYYNTFQKKVKIPRKIANVLLFENYERFGYYKFHLTCGYAGSYLLILKAIPVLFH